MDEVGGGGGDLSYSDSEQDRLAYYEQQQLTVNNDGRQLYSVVLYSPHLVLSLLIIKTI